MESSVGDNERQRVFPRQAQQAKQNVEDLQSRERLHSTIECAAEDTSQLAIPSTGKRLGNLLCPHIPEDLGPEDAVDAGGDLVGGGAHDDEAGEVVLDELSHGEG